MIESVFLKTQKDIADNGPFVEDDALHPDIQLSEGKGS
jgi:hypothetical protein